MTPLVRSLAEQCSGKSISLIVADLPADYIAKAVSDAGRLEARRARRRKERRAIRRQAHREDAQYRGARGVAPAV